MVESKLNNTMLDRISTTDQAAKHISHVNIIPATLT